MVSTVIKSGDRTERRRIHPHKFAMWLAIASIMMMFAGFTSGYIVRKAQGDWLYFKMPSIFWVSTVVILLSSATYMLGLRAFKVREMKKYRWLMASTLTLGVAFIVLQTIGFWQLLHISQLMHWETGRAENRVSKMSGNVSESFLFIIVGAHLLHILAGVIALLVVYLKAYRKRVKVYNATGLEIVGTFWHFVDLLWIYLFIFFLANQ